MAQTIDDINFTVESREKARKIASNVQVSWKKALDPNITIFTIGVSTIGGTDVIGGPQGFPSEWNKYLYSDETDHLLSLDYQYGLNTPIGGISKGLFEIRLDNTDKRYLPDFMGGDSELFTVAGRPRRPVIINAGFNYGGSDKFLPQFVGITTRNPLISLRSRTMDLVGADFIDFLENQYVDRTTMFTSLRSDEVIEDLLSQLGYSTSQYDLDTGINIIPFGIYERGTRFSHIINELVQSEYGQFYQDEEGKLRFENRQHWDLSPHNSIVRSIYTSDVLESETIGQHDIINVVEVKSNRREKQQSQIIFELPISVEIGANSDKEVFVDYDDPILEVLSQGWTANSDEFGGGTDLTSNVTIKSRQDFARSSKYVFHNSSSQAAYLLTLVIDGRPAKVVEEIYVRRKDDSSVTAYEEQPYVIENPYIQNEDWAESFAQMVLNDFGEPENLQKLTIRAMPELQVGDLVDWQGKSWRIYDIATTIDPADGFIQELKILRRDITAYFRIGISTIGGGDQIAP